MIRRYKYASVFKELYSFRGYKFNGFFNEKDIFFVFLKKKNKTCKCPSCGRRSGNIEDSYKRTLRDIDLSNKRCYITFFEHKIQCSCGYRGIEELEFVRPYSRCTLRFEEYVAFLCEKMCLSDVSQLTGLGWRTIKVIDKAKLRDLILDVSQLEPKRLGIDEIAYQKGHKYLTVVRDIDLGKVIWIGMCRKQYLR